MQITPTQCARITAIKNCKPRPCKAAKQHADTAAALLVKRRPRDARIALRAASTSPQQRIRPPRNNAAASRKTISRRALSTRRVVLQRPTEAGAPTSASNTTTMVRNQAQREPALEATAGALPAGGLPPVVKDGYGTYALLQFAGFACSSAGGVLSTRVLLTAVGVGGRASAAPLAAAANWAVKDGLGMLGGVAFASIWSGALDARPRRWRLRSSVALDAAALVELAALPAFPQYFVPIAGLANVAKNISYLAASASRAAIHRALSNRQGAANLGDLTAKSGSQTIVASLVGLGLGVGVSNACGGDVTTVLAGLGCPRRT